MSANKETSRSEAAPERLQQSLAFLHQAREVRGLQTAQVERIERRLTGRSHRPRRRVLLPALATLALVLVAGAAFAVAKGGLHLLPIVGPLFVPAVSTQNAKAEKQRRAAPKPALERPPVATSPHGVPPVAVALQPVSQPQATNRMAGSHSPSSLPPLPAQREEGRSQGPHPRALALRDAQDSHRAAFVAEAPATPAPLAAAEKAEDPIVAESRSFASVIEPWHRTRNASTTLALLDAHESRYPSGSMRLEARVLRAEIYLAQGRESEALNVLDAVSLSGLPRGRELQTVRGELRIKAGRCGEGKRDLGDVLEKGVADALAKRAAQAMSHCP
jgi:hypothetical protein